MNAILIMVIVKKYVLIQMEVSIVFVHQATVAMFIVQASNFFQIYYAYICHFRYR